MGFLKRLFGSFFGETKEVAQFTENDADVISQSAARMAEVVNESLKVARESKNLATRRSRLQVAKQSLSELIDLADTFESVELFSLDEIERQVALLDEELNPGDRSEGTEVVSSQIDIDDSYFVTMTEMVQAIPAREYDRALSLVHNNIRQLPGFVRSCVAQYGSLDVGLPVIHQGGTILALMGDDQGLQEMMETVQSVPELGHLQDEVERHLEDRTLFASILAAVEANPEVLQPDVKKLVACDDGHRIARLISWLEKAGNIVRTKKGRTYSLSLANTGQPDPAPDRVITSHRQGKESCRISVIDLSSLAYVPLPKAPPRWEESGKAKADISPAVDGFFEVRETDTWEVTEVQKVPVAERPDPAFRHIYPTNDGLTLIDDLGNAEEFAGAPAAAMCFDREGSCLASRPLLHGVYRTDVNALGRGFASMSKECVVHAYGDDISPMIETAMREAPEVLALQKRLSIIDEELHRHLRCVSLAHDQSRYLVTGVDEAWCMTPGGEAIWSVRLPFAEGWNQVAASSDRYDTSQEIHRALDFMELSLPVSPDDVKRRYRQLAKRYHPDVNRDDPNAESRMKALGAAVETLTGLDTSMLPEDDGPRFYREQDQFETSVDGMQFTVSVGVGGGEADAADWIYAATFAGQKSGAYLAGYSGRVVEVDGAGEAVRAYDIGAVPRRIIDTGDYLYFLTDTRLYILRGELLCGIIDTADGGDLIVGQTGFGLLEKKRFRWFREDGIYLGSVVSKNPIRRAYHGRDGLVIETRQRRAIVRGAPVWWE
jgi:hypothetical protein